MSTSQSLHKHEILVFNDLYIYNFIFFPKEHTKEACISTNCCQGPRLLSCSDFPDCGLLVLYFPPKCLIAIQYHSYRLGIIVVSGIHLCIPVYLHFTCKTCKNYFPLSDLRNMTHKKHTPKISLKIGNSLDSFSYQRYSFP